MKVTFVITGLSMGGAEGMLYKLLAHNAALRGGGVVSLRCGGELEEPIRELGVEVDCLGMQSGFPNPVALPRLYGLLRRRKPDVISSWMYHADLMAGLAGRMTGVPVAWGIRNSTVDAAGTKAMTRQVIRACALLSGLLPARIVSCSAAARDVHIALGYKADRMTVIPNGFDVRRFGPSAEARASVRQEIGLPESARLVGLVARFDPQKNHTGFLRAAAKVLAQEPQARFLMAGPGVDRDNRLLAREVEQLGLGQSVFMLGPRSDMPRIMAALDVLVVSSTYGEAFPNVVGEAMACEVPCVVTDVGDCAFVVADTGVVVPPGDEAGLADGMLRLFRLGSRDRLEIGRRARRRIVEHFDLASVSGQYEALFRALAAGR